MTAAAVTIGALALAACSGDDTTDETTTSGADPTVEITDEAPGAEAPEEGPEEPAEATEDASEENTITTPAGSEYTVSETPQLDGAGMTAPGTAHPTSVPLAIGVSGTVSATGEMTDDYLPVILEFQELEYGDWADWEPIVGDQFDGEMTPVYLRYRQDGTAFTDGVIPAWHSSPSVLTKEGSTAELAVVGGGEADNSEAIMNNEHCPISFGGGGAYETCVFSFIPAGETAELVELTYNSPDGSEAHKVAWVVED